MYRRIARPAKDHCHGTADIKNIIFQKEDHFPVLHLVGCVEVVGRHKRNQAGGQNTGPDHSQHDRHRPLLQQAGHAFRSDGSGPRRSNGEVDAKRTFQGPDQTDHEFSLVENERTESYDAIMDDLRKKSQELVFLINVEESDKLIKLLNYIVDLNQMTDFIANYFVMDFRKRYRLYNEIGVKKRGLLLIFELSELISDMTKKRKKISL
jgi:hypothetical protein